MDLKIAVLPGDGIGPEISEQGVAVMNAVCEKFGHHASYQYALCGAEAIDKVGDPFPEETFKVCMDADAVLFSAHGQGTPRTRTSGHAQEVRFVCQYPSGGDF